MIRNLQYLPVLANLKDFLPNRVEAVADNVNLWDSPPYFIWDPPHNLHFLQKLLKSSFQGKVIFTTCLWIKCNQTVLNLTNDFSLTRPLFWAPTCRWLSCMTCCTEALVNHSMDTSRRCARLSPTWPLHPSEMWVKNPLYICVYICNYR